MEITKKEAIELLKERYMVMSMCVNKDYCAKQNAAIDVAIAALSEDIATDINVGRNEGLKGNRAMTDNEVIEALDFCEGYNDVSFCSDCQLFDKDNCIQISSHEAYSLINRQKAEIEQLKAKNEILIKNADTAFQDGLNEAQDLYASQIRNEVKQEVIKEFIERLKDELRLDDDCEHDCYDCCYGCKDYAPVVDKLVKDMIKEPEDKDAGNRIYDDFMKSCKL